ncbi:MAG: LapA family protein [Candidatus Altimarinota bacterium]
MRKTFFLSVTLILAVLVLILGFENITSSQSFLLLFYETELRMTWVVFLSAFLGFLIGFFAMLYSYEKGREKMEEEDREEIASAPAATAETQKSDEPEKKVEESIDQFDEEDEILE